MGTPDEMDSQQDSSGEQRMSAEANITRLIGSVDATRGVLVLWAFTSYVSKLHF
jgi:hypothetical protein